MLGTMNGRGPLEVGAKPTSRTADLGLRAAGQINAGIEKYFWVITGLFLLHLLATAILTDIQRPMWIDELYTLNMAKQASAREIIQATFEGCEAAPPLYELIVHLLLRWIPNEGLAVRIPSTLGFCCMIPLLLKFCRRRMPAAYAWIAALLLCNAAWWTLTEGRAYGLLLGCSAAVLVCWQSACDGRRRNLHLCLLGVLLGLMTALHYYSIFFVAPIVLAEIFRLRERGEFSYALFALILIPFGVFVLHLPLISSGRQLMEHNWSPAAWSQIPDTYGALMSDLGAAPLLALIFSEILPTDSRARLQLLTQQERVLAYGLLSMPLVVIALAKYSTHVFVARYTVWALAGIAILVAAMLHNVARNAWAVGLLTLGILAVFIRIHEITDEGQRNLLREGQSIWHDLASLPDKKETIVIADHHVFMELSYYGGPELTARLLYPVNRDLDLRYFGYDTGALLMTAYSHRTNLRIQEYDLVLRKNKSFLLAAGPRDYLPSHLAKNGYSVVPISNEVPPLIYQVDKLQEHP